MTARTTAAARLVFRLGSEEAAARVAASLAPENGPHCVMETEGANLIVTVDDRLAGSMAQTVDDVLACVTAALRADQATEPSRET